MFVHSAYIVLSFGNHFLLKGFYLVMMCNEKSYRYKNICVYTLSINKVDSFYNYYLFPNVVFVQIIFNVVLCLWSQIKNICAFILCTFNIFLFFTGSLRSTDLVYSLIPSHFNSFF